jgi:4-hydroxybenzoyl-CoA reductase subunit beta
MMRLPHFTFHSPQTVRQAAELLAEAGAGAMLVAGGTDLLPNMKRRQQVPSTLIGLRRIAELRQIGNGAGLTIGAGVTLTEIVRDRRVRGHDVGDAPGPYAALWQAAVQVATPHLRNMGTLGGNLCLDTRCNYYDQNYEWRKAIDFCMKKDGEICWVATASKRCVAMSSTDCAPALIALGATAKLASPGGEREIPVENLFKNDGIDYLTRQPDEILTELRIPDRTAPGIMARSTYWKLRRRGAFDFPVLGVAAAVIMKNDIVEKARIALGAVASRPFLVDKAGEFLEGKSLDDAVIAEAVKITAARAKPMDNADLDLYWRKEVTSEFVSHALRELRGDDMREVRFRVARQLI